MPSIENEISNALWTENRKDNQMKDEGSKHIDDDNAVSTKYRFTLVMLVIKP